MQKTTSPPTTSAFARALREARRRRGETLEEAGARLRISPQYLDALERDAPLHVFPAPVYAGFFLRQYARHLGLNEDRVMRAFAARHGLAERQAREVARGASDGAARPTPPQRRAGSRPSGRFDPPQVPLAPARRPRLSAPTRSSPGGRGSLVPRGLTARPRVLGHFRERPKFRRRVSYARRRAVAVGAVTALLVAAGVVIVPRFLADREAGRSNDPDATGVVVPPPPKTLPGGGSVVFPDFRVVAYYGAAHDSDLGILGVGPTQAADQLVEVAQSYEFGSRPVLPAFEIIGVLATRGAGDEGLYRAPLPRADLDSYLAAAREIGALFIIDIQPGRSDFMTEIERYEDLLSQPDVGLALDPEWRVGPDELPGRDIGTVDAAEINEVTDYLADLVSRHDLPQKLLIIHQFTYDMITNKDAVETPPGIAITFDIDGFGEPSVKRAKYEDFSAPFDQFFHGFKLFYTQDTELMTPLETLGLRPTPDFIVYQ